MDEAKRRPDCPSWCDGHRNGTRTCFSTSQRFGRELRFSVQLAQDLVNPVLPETEPRLLISGPKSITNYFFVELRQAAGFAAMLEALDQALAAQVVRELAAAAAAEKGSDGSD